MDLYLIRHADAVALGEQGITDDVDRPLTPEGETQARNIAAALRKHGVMLKLVVTSPLRRARQTADALMRDWPAPVPELLVCDELAPGGKRRKLAKFLESWNAEQVALVGHQPDIDTLAGWLIGSKKASLCLAKAAVAHIACANEIDKGCGTLTWMVPPEWMGD